MQTGVDILTVRNKNIENVEVACQNDLFNLVEKINVKWRFQLCTIVRYQVGIMR